DVEAILDGRCRRLGMAAGAAATGLNHVTLTAGASGAPAHCHSHEEELFAVLAGGGVLELIARGETKASEHSLRAGDVVSRPAGTGVAHALRAGAEGMTYLAYGTRDPGDMCFYPQSGRVSLRGLGIALRSPEIEHLPAL
ncbi:MAG TPA: cupin domain-containing protein, partial [Usitatibacter sp.]|nr:cupin domain-containing protein [Usitatibacter sp.]